jgi:hypothetical protein
MESRGWWLVIAGWWLVKSGGVGGFASTDH